MEKLKDKSFTLFLKLFLYLAFSSGLVPSLTAVQSFVYRFHAPPAPPVLGIALRCTEGVS